MNQIEYFANMLFESYEVSDLSEDSLFGEDLFDFDIDMFDMPESSVDTSASTSSSPSQDWAAEPTAPSSSNKIVLKSTARPLRKKLSKKTRKTLMNGNKAPNMSRKSQGAVMYAFPSFDKCDSLLFLPTTLSKFINSADFSAVGELFQAHTSKDCQVSLMSNLLTLNISSFVKLYELAGELYPDTLTCVHSTKVVGNTIQATMYTKYTDCAAIFDGVMKSRAKDELFQSLCMAPDRLDRYRGKILPHGRSPKEITKILAPAALDVNLITYANLTMNFTFDDSTRKITRIEYVYDVTSLVAA